jgi:hypothetical protein
MLMSIPPVLVAPSVEGAGSWSRMPSGKNPISAQSSTLVKRSTMPVSRAVISGNLSSLRP